MSKRLGEMDRNVACMTESDVVRLVAGRLGEADRTRAQLHLDGCEACARLVTAVASESTPRSGSGGGDLRPPVLAPGTLVAGRYRIGRFLGSGGMGEVHEAEDLLLGKKVALKTLNARFNSDPGAVARLRSEVAMAHRVTHPNVCRIFDLGVHEGPGTIVNEGSSLFLTMEYLMGETLSAFIRRRGPMAPRTRYQSYGRLRPGWLPRI